MKKKEIVDDVTMKRAITRITYEIIERNKNLDKIVLAGIKTRGVYIAQRIQERLKQLENLDVPLIELDTKAFRDDVKAEQDTSVFPIEIDGTDVILVDDVLYTGRTHQIRVHMAYIGHPVAGDPLYGPRKTLKGHGQFLHAKTLGFTHPTTGELVEFTAEEPAIFKETLEKLREA